MAILIRGSFQVTYCRQIAGGKRGEKVAGVVLVIGLVGLADVRNRSGRQVVGIGRLLVVLERLVVWNVVAGRGDCVIAREPDMVRAADRRAACGRGRGLESALEPAG